MCTPIGSSAPTVRPYTLSNTVLASRSRVGARAEVTKNDLGKVSRFFFQTNVISANYGVSGSTATVPADPPPNKDLAPPQQPKPLNSF